MGNLNRLLAPSSIAVVGGGAWCRQIVKQSLKMGFVGDIWPVHPRHADIEGVASFADLKALPGVPDAVFIGVNRHSTLDVVAQLSRMGAGGAVCFASGFSEAIAEDATGSDLQTQLVAAAGDMPILGPNCYGFINALDGALLWPDQHGCQRVDRGVAILTQSSNIAINLTMQKRSLPVGFVVTCGNMAQTQQAQIAMALLDDPRITALGLHIEGFADTQLWHDLAMKAHEKSVPLVALKVGRSDQARQATVSHTASLAGSDAGAEGLLRRLGIGRVPDLPTFLETLKLLHFQGPLATPTLSAISCSGGEASLAADTADQRALSFPPLNVLQKRALKAALGPMVALSNPLDYHTYVWGDAAKMADAWAPMADAHIGLTLIIVDYPHTDATDWVSATKAAIMVRARTGRAVAVVATLPELMPMDVAEELAQGGVIPMMGLTEAIAAAEIAANLRAPDPVPPLPPGAPRVGTLVAEADAKALLGRYGVPVPMGHSAKNPAQAAMLAKTLNAPLALKGQGLAHKSEAGAVRLGLTADDVEAAAAQIDAPSYLVEEMAQNGCAELLIGVTRDPAHGFVLTLGAGGVLTELWRDTVSMLLPVTRAQVATALEQLRIYPLLMGYRSKPGADLGAVVDAILSVQDCVIAQVDAISEVEINPLICAPDRAVAVDALILMTKDV